MGLDTVELVMEFEDEFDISIPDEDAEKIQTLGQTVDYVMRRLQERPRRGVCLSAHAFYQLRRELAAASRLPPTAIRPTSSLGSILTDDRQRRRWVGIAQRCGFPIPRRDFRHPLRPLCPDPDTRISELVHQRYQPSRIRYREELNREEVWEKIKTITANQARVDPNELQWDTHYINDLP